MSQLQIVSRKDLFNGGDEVDEVNETNFAGVELPIVDFEIVEVDQNDDKQSLRPGSGGEEEDQFDFPLFSMGVSSGDTDNDNKSTLMKVSLKETPVEMIKQERPISYYYAKSTEADLKKIHESAIDYNDIFRDIDVIVNTPRSIKRILDVRKHNAAFDEIQSREKILKNRRPCQKQRLAKKLGAEKVEVRKEQMKQLKKEMKKRFHKRGGKKNKKKPALNPLANAGATPKFRTE